MVMFKAKFKPASDRPSASDKPRVAQQQPQPIPPQPKGNDQKDKVPPIEKERGPQYPVKEPGPGHPPERVR